MGHPDIGRERPAAVGRPLMAANRATAAVLLAIGALIGGCSTATPSSSPSTLAATASSSAGPALGSPSATVAGTPTASPTPTTQPSGTSVEGWSPVPEQPSVQRVQFQNVVWTGTRFVATGAALDGNGTFVDSTDGLTWNRQAIAMPNAYPGALAAGPRGVVAVGTIGDRPASWSSPDGLAWTARAGAFPLPALGTDVVQVTAVVATDDGWLAVGRRDPLCQLNCGLAPVRALAWTSSDGLHWTRVPDQAAFGRAAMTGVARLAAGFVAVGLAKGRAVVWTSADGSTWTRLADDPAFHPRSGSTSGAWIQMNGVAVGHGVAVAVGMDGGGSGSGEPSVRAWWSADGRTWAAATGDRFPTGQVFSVAATPDGFLATGPSGADSCLGGMWASTDGRAWACVASDPAFTGFGPYAAAASSSAVVAVGLTSGGGDSPEGLPGAVWRRTLP